MVIHPGVDNLAYARTDNGGAFRWDESGQRWIPLTDWIPLSQSNLFGVESIAIDPSDPDIVYLAAGKAKLESPHDVLKSTDRGQTFQFTGLNLRMAGNGARNPPLNGEERAYGERLLVDPNLGSTIYFASRFDGLWKSTDSAGTWQQVTSFPNIGDDPVGLDFVLFDKATGTTGNPTQTIYVASYGNGIYRSTDGGSTWSLLSGSPTEPTRGAVAPNGTLYVAHNSGVAKFAGGTWSDISPSADVYNGISVDPTNSNIVMTVRSDPKDNNAIYRSTNGGSSWSQIAITKNSTVPWWQDKHFSDDPSSLVIDPRFPSRVWIPDLNGVWRTDDITVSPSTWTNYEHGHEQLSTTGDLKSPPSGDVLLHTALSDKGGFDLTSLTDYPDAMIRDKGLTNITGTSVDFQETDPNFVVWVGRKGNEAIGKGGYSTDGGTTYTQFPSIIGMGGRVAVSANSQRIVWSVQAGGVYVSTDKGSNWTAAVGAPSSAIGGTGNHVFIYPLASDRVNGSKFYLYKAGTFYRSTDGGANWSDTGAIGLPNVGNTAFMTVAAAPGTEGEVWAGFDGNGLYHSSDSGTTFTQLSDVQSVRLMAFGKNAPSHTNPALYVYGTVDNIDGIFRSDDMGATWIQIDSPSIKIGDNPGAMAGDRQVFGRVYIATGGRGIFYGAPATKVDDTSGSITYVGGSDWVVAPNTHDYNGSTTRANQAGDAAQFTFSGTSIKVIARKSSDDGYVNIRLDGTVVATNIDTYSATTSFQQEIYSNSTLSPGTHTISVEPTGTHNGSSTDSRVKLDYFEYY
jgi:hypothetical protein